MEDCGIIELYFARSESALDETAKKYGGLCRYIARSILDSPEDAEECVNDTLMRAWESIPPNRPDNLAAFIGRLARNSALNRAVFNSAKKRGGDGDMIAEEISELSIPSSQSGEAIDDALALRDAVNSFLASLPGDQRILFVRRYWYMSTLGDIARDYGLPLGTVKSTLSRLRKRLKNHLIKEGITL